MVNPAANRRGRGMLGCLFPLVLLALFLYLGVKFGRPWFANQQFQDEMRSAAKFADTLSDSAIHARIVARADSLRLPAEARNGLRLTRLGGPPRILIETRYTVTVELPVVGPRVMQFEPRVEEPL